MTDMTKKGWAWQMLTTKVRGGERHDSSYKFGVKHYVMRFKMRPKVCLASQITIDLFSLQVDKDVTLVPTRGIQKGMLVFLQDIEDWKVEPRYNFDN